MATSTQKTISTTASQIVSALPFDQTIAIHSGSGTVYIGDSTVTSSTGYRMDNGDKITLPVGDHESLYAITSSGTAILYIYLNTN